MLALTEEGIMVSEKHLKGDPGVCKGVSLWSVLMPSKVNKVRHTLFHRRNLEYKLCN